MIRHVSSKLLLLSCAVALVACQSNPTKPTAAAPSTPAAPVPTQAAQAAPAAPACEKLPTLSNTQKVAAGAAIGAAAGLLVAKASGGSKGRHFANGALGGALVGALAGSAFKNEIDVEEQPDGSVRLKIPGSVMFTSGQAALSSGFQSTLTSVTTTVKKYCGVTVRVVGHTDSMGAPASNQQLSERRAASVQSHMQGQGLDRARVAIEGKGEREPIASNADETGRQQNRRVEIFVRPPAS